MSENLTGYRGATPDPQPDPMEARINGAFSDFGRTMGALAVPTDHGGTIPGAYRAYMAVEDARAMLAATAENTASAIEDVIGSDDPRLTPEVRDSLVRQNLELWDITKAQAERDLRAGVASIRAGLGEIFASKVQVADSVDRQLIRQEIQQALDANPKQTRTAVLSGLVQQDAARYGPEISSTFGKGLLALANEAEHHGAVSRRALDLIPDTKVSANARAALQAMDKTQIEGLIGAITWKASQRVEAAKGAQRPGLVSEAFRLRGGRI